jgi:uncharacterized delta-60 repeat protein
MSYQNINQYVFKRLYLKPLNEITDISLASDERDYDEEVIFSPFLIGEDDGNRMPLNFDINSPNTINCINCGNFDSDVIVSENYWNPLGIDLLVCSAKTELCDVGLTGMDNGLVKRFSGETIELNTGLYTSTADKFSRYKYDRRFKMHPITGFTTTSDRIYNDDSYTYNLSIDNDANAVGNYIKFDGGFYQGFYKSFGYDYEVLPERFNLGWSSEFMLRYRWTGDTSVGLNERYPDNKGIFFYYGTRAENKFYHYANGSPITDSGYTRVTEGLNCLQTCGCSQTGYTASTCGYVYQQSGVTSQNCACGNCPCNCTTYASIPELNPLYDGVSNALSLRLSGDTGSPRLCVKTYRITGGCETTGVCSTGITYTTGTSVTEWCSTRGIFDDCSGTTYSQEERWVQIDAVFQRYTYWDDCDLLYKGGLGEIVKTVFTASSAHNSVSLIEPPITQEIPYDPATVEVVNITERWVDEKNDRLGSFRFYVNGKLFLVVENFEEIIPRPLNTARETQVGVAYNISLGGGTQGLHDNLTLSGCPVTLTGMTYQQDPECLTTEILDETEYSGLTTHIRLEKFFGGSFIGDISAFRMYSEPLNAGQVRHNFRLLKNRYGLLDPFCLKCEEPPVPATATPTPTPTVTPTPTITPTTSITPTFTPTVTITPSTSQACVEYGPNDGNVNHIDQYGDRLYVAGSFNTFSGTSSPGLVRLFLNGDIDTSYNLGTGFVGGHPTYFEAQSNGKFVYGGNFTSFDGNPTGRIVRLNTNGSYDATFITGTGFDGTITSLLVLPDDKILVGGQFSNYDGNPVNYFCRLNSNGTLDNSFLNGLPDNSVFSIARQSDGKLIVAGSFTNYNGNVAEHIVRINSNGSYDNTFNTTNGFNNTVSELAIQPDGKIICAGAQFTTYSGVSANRIIRLNVDATIDNTFNYGTGFNAQVLSIGLQTDGKILAAGQFTSYSGVSSYKIIRLNSNGSFDNTFDNGIISSTGVLFIGQLQNTRIAIGGIDISYYDGDIVYNWAILNENGGLIDCTLIPVSQTPTNTQTPTMTPTVTPSHTTIFESCSIIRFIYVGPQNPTFEFTDCSGNTIQMTGVEDWSNDFCGDYNSVLIISGDGRYSYVGPCPDPSIYNPTTLQLGYNFLDPNASCSASTTTYYQSPSESLVVGDHIYSDYSLDPYFYVTDGYYSDGTNVYIVTGNTGYIDSIIPCPNVTPTQTPTNTPTPTPTMPDSNFLLQENYSMILQQDGFGILIQASSPSPTPTTTETPTQTPTESETLTPTPTLTNTPTTSVTETPTETPTNTPTETETPTPTTTPTITETPTNTPSETPTLTPTITETPTPTITPTITETPTNTPTVTPTPNIVTSGLIMQLDANKTESYPGSGTTVFDLTGSFDNTLSGGATFTTLNGIKCFDCSTGTESIQVIGTGPSLPTTGYTYVTWAKVIPSSAGWRSLLRTNNNLPILVQVGTDDLGYYNFTFQDSGYNITADEDVWVQYAVVGDNTSSVFYINGTQVGSVAFGAGGDTHVMWGNNLLAGQSFGYLANLYFYNRKLNFSEIGQMYDFLSPSFIEMTPTATNTPTNTETPTITPTPSITPTNTISPTPTSTSTPTVTATNTPTNTTTSSPTPSSTPGQPVTSNLVLYYDPSNPSSYSGSGTVINDLSSNGLNGTMSNITFTSPYFTFNGTSSQISVADNALLEPGSSDWSIEFWVNHSVIAGASRILIAKTDGGASADWGYGLRTVANSNTFMEVGNGGVTSVTSPLTGLSINTWYQVVGVWTNVASNSIALYINGNLIGSNSHSFASIKNTTSPLYLGSFNGGQFSQWLNGRMGVVRMYSKSLSGSEVLQNFNADKSKYGL